MKKDPKKVFNSIKGDLLVILLDIFAVNVSYLLVLLIRLSFLDNFHDALILYRDGYLTFAPWYTTICILVFYIFRLYGGMWKYAGINDLNRIIFANAVTGGILIVATLVFFVKMPISYYIVGALFQFLLIMAIRFAYRFFVIERRKLTQKKSEALIIGGGEEAYSMFRVLDSGMTYRPVCFVDKETEGRTINGIHGRINSIFHFLSQIR